MDGWMGRWMAIWMGKWMARWMDEGMDGRGVDGSLGRWRKGGSKKKS